MFDRALSSHRNPASMGALRRRIFLATASALTMLAVNPQAVAKPIGNWSAAPSAAAIAAAQSGSQEAAEAARDANNALKRATLAIQAMQSTQAAARDAARAALNAMPSVPNGLTAGGLQIGAGVKAPDGSIDSSLWQGANLPTQFTDGGRTKVDINQTQQKAILTWDTFNIGANTDLNFNQHGNSNWVALNRVLDPNMAPSKILGSMTADGSVYVINANGIIFGHNSQVNVGTLIASTANISDDQFLNKGIYSTRSGNTYVPSFTGATGTITVKAGAQIETHEPATGSSGGGFVLLMGSAVDNAGTISTPDGQTMLTAGHDFVLRQGFSTDGNDASKASTTRGNEIATGSWNGSVFTPGGGDVSNEGLIFSQQGDITLAGHSIEQNGILLSTTSVNQRGTIHLLNSASDSLGSITLGGTSVTDVMIELDSDDTALNSQRDALIKASDAANLLRAGAASGAFDNLSLLADRQDQSRIEIVTGGTVVPAGTGGDASDRYYTPGGLLEVGGYLANTAHKIGEWASVGGTITLSAPEVIAQKGSIFAR
jgi:filamentous hemagglutinin family protein